jgi:hypothetical protein
MAVYGFSGVVCLTLGVLFLGLLGSPWFYFPVMLLLSGLLFLSTLYGIATRKGWVREFGRGLSGSVLLFFLIFTHSVYRAVRDWLCHPQLDLGGAILVSGLTLFAANALCFYYWTRPHVKAYFRN